MTGRRRKWKKMKTKPVDKTEDEIVRSDNDEDDDVSAIIKEKRAAEKLTPAQVRLLQNLIIDLRHDVLPQHQVESSAGSRAPSAKEQHEFKEYEPNYKKGSFSPEEDQIIVDNWKAFCEVHGWNSTDPKPFLFHRHHYHFYVPKFEERKKFVQFLADGLPHRSLYSVYHRFRNLYDPHKVDKYTFVEDGYIIDYIERHKGVDESRKFADLAKVLNRTRASVWRRYRLLNKKREAEEESE